MTRRRFLLFVLVGALLAAPSGAGAATPIAQADGFAAWLKQVYQEGLERGISKATLDTALTGLTPLERVIKLDRRQPEFTQTFREYINRRVSPWRVSTGRERLATHGTVLKAVGQRFGVQPRFIVALWGIETNFGRHTGGFSVVRALATLAFDGRRSAYFRKELFNALTIIDQGHIAAADMKGSWAGAMGQNQFMPSSFLSYAIDYDGDGRRDIWGTLEDVFASAANYLRRAGWRADQTWGREVTLPDGFDQSLAALMPQDKPRGCRALRKLTVAKTLPEWHAMGLRRADGGPLPTRPLEASLVLPDGPGGPALLVYQNFRATLRWNCSVSFAAAVGMLADALVRR
ncbi:MAG: lytic murein transglycosylase [Alphaproteobacteria bacterium]|nr:lytic murein transglycosylase [Alphaproteobacteria bacterium]